ncbi:uncharacterized protein LOC144363917 [Saccoglossus kowalevskii]
MDYVDDCGAWDNKSSGKTHHYIMEGDRLKFYVDLKDGLYCRDVKRKRVPLKPQPNVDDVIVFRRYYIVLKRDSNYKKRISTVIKCRDSLAHLKKTRGCGVYRIADKLRTSVLQPRKGNSWIPLD